MTSNQYELKAIYRKDSRLKNFAQIFSDKPEIK